MKYDGEEVSNICYLVELITTYFPLGVIQAQPEVHTPEWFFHRGEVALPSQAGIDMGLDGLAEEANG
jgi:hypothetical protein